MRRLPKVSTASLSPLPSSPTSSDDSEGVTITFNNSNGLLSLAKKGHLTKGRMVHVTGHISGVTEVYEKDGMTQLLKRPRLSLDSNTAQLVLGAMPKQDTLQRAAGGTGCS